MRDFSSQMYAVFLRTMLESGYQALPLEDWCAGIRAPRTVILRHDVDRFPGRALELARIENRQGVRSTYYFRYKRSVFVPEIVREIHALGHEIGYHYEVLADAGGNPDAARALFAGNIAEIRRLVPVKTVAMHGRPLSPYCEVDFWEHASLDEFGLAGEAYLSFCGENVPYLNDTGRTWCDGACNLRDRLPLDGPPPLKDSPNECVDALPAGLRVRTTKQLLSEMGSGVHPVLYLSFHPERWPGGLLAQGLGAVQDAACNCIKFTLKKVRHAAS